MLVLYLVLALLLLNRLRHLPLYLLLNCDLSLSDDFEVTPLLSSSSLMVTFSSTKVILLSNYTCFVAHEWVTFVFLGKSVTVVRFKLGTCWFLEDLFTFTFFLFRSSPWTLSPLPHVIFLSLIVCLCISQDDL